MPNSPTKQAWNDLFESARALDDGAQTRANMILRGDSKFFTNIALDTFFNFTFWDLGKETQKQILSLTNSG